MVINTSITFRKSFVQLFFCWKNLLMHRPSLNISFLRPSLSFEHISLYWFSISLLAHKSVFSCNSEVHLLVYFIKQAIVCFMVLHVFCIWISFVGTSDCGLPTKNGDIHKSISRMWHDFFCELTDAKIKDQR